MLQLPGQRAELANGQNILELGCGWGSLSLWMAKTYPLAKVTGVSNSRTQKEFIMARAAERDIKNLEIITEHGHVRTSESWVVRPHRLHRDVRAHEELRHSV